MLIPRFSSVEMVTLCIEMGRDIASDEDNRENWMSEKKFFYFNGLCVRVFGERKPPLSWHSAPEPWIKKRDCRLLAT
jgi:hypothetical protein